MHHHKWKESNDFVWKGDRQLSIKSPIKFKIIFKVPKSTKRNIYWPLLYEVAKLHPTKWYVKRCRLVVPRCANQQKEWARKKKKVFHLSLPSSSRWWKHPGAVWRSMPQWRGVRARWTRSRSTGAAGRGRVPEWSSCHRRRSAHKTHSKPSTWYCWETRPSSPLPRPSRSPISRFLSTDAHPPHPVPLHRDRSAALACHLPCLPPWPKTQLKPYLFHQFCPLTPSSSKSTPNPHLPPNQTTVFKGTT